MPDQLHATMLALYEKLGPVEWIDGGQKRRLLPSPNISLTCNWKVEYWEPERKAWLFSHTILDGDVELRLRNAGLERLRREHDTVFTRQGRGQAVVQMQVNNPFWCSRPFVGTTLAEAVLLAVDAALPKGD